MLTTQAGMHADAVLAAVRAGPSTWREWLAHPTRVPVRRRNADGTPQLTIDQTSGEVIRDEALGECGRDICEPLYRYDVVNVYSPGLVEELLLDERNKALADVNWWYRRELKRMTNERDTEASEPYRHEKPKSNPFDDIRFVKGKEPVAPRMYPMERRGYSIFGGVFHASERAPADDQKALPQISDALWPKAGTTKWGPMGKLTETDMGEHGTLLGEGHAPAPTYDSRGHVVPYDNRRRRVVTVGSLWETVPTNRMPHVPLPHLHYPQARWFTEQQLDEPWTETKLEPIVEDVRQQRLASIRQKQPTVAETDKYIKVDETMGEMAPRLHRSHTVGTFE